MSSTRAELRLVLLGALATASAGCGGCGSARPDPLVHLAESPEALVIVVDRAGVLAERREALIGRLTRLSSKTEVDAALAELVRVVGFDPTTAAGLAEGGLAEAAPLAVELDLGKLAPRLAVLPVADRARVSANLLRIAGALAPLKRTATEKRGAHDVTTSYAAFGPAEVPLLSHAFAGGYAIVGTRPELVSAALERKVEESLAKSPRVSARAASLAKYPIRVYAPGVGAFVDGVLGTLSAFRAGGGAPLRSPVASVGAGLSLADDALTGEAEIELTELGRAQVEKLGKVSAPPPKGALALRGGDTVLFVRAALDLAAAVRSLRAQNPSLAALLERLDRNVSELSGVSLLDDLVSGSTGQVAIGLGVLDLAGVADLRAAVAQPASVLWTAAAFGSATDLGPKLEAAAQKLDATIAAQGLDKALRDAEGTKVLSIGRAKDGQRQTVLDLGAGPTGWFFANTAEASGRLSSPPKGASDPLGDGPGLFVELSIPPVVARLAGLDPGALAQGAEKLLVMAMIEKLKLTLGELRALTITVRPRGPLVHAVGRLELSPSPPGASR